MKEAKKLGDRLWVIVNNDIQVGLKGSTPFMTAQDRLEIVSSLRCVDYAHMSIDNDRTVKRTLAVLFDTARNHGPVIFANGGDATKDTVPENEVCEELGIEAVYGVVPQLRESSKILKKAGING